MSEAIFVQGLAKSYNGKTVVDHLDLSVSGGTVFGLLGGKRRGKKHHHRVYPGHKAGRQRNGPPAGTESEETPPPTLPAYRRTVSGGKLSPGDSGLGTLRGDRQPVPCSRRLAEAV